MITSLYMPGITDGHGRGAAGLPTRMTSTYPSLGTGTAVFQPDAGFRVQESAGTYSRPDRWCRRHNQARAGLFPKHQNRRFTLPPGSGDTWPVEHGPFIQFRLGGMASAGLRSGCGLAPSRRGEATRKDAFLASARPRHQIQHKPLDHHTQWLKSNVITTHRCAPFANEDGANSWTRTGRREAIR